MGADVMIDIEGMDNRMVSAPKLSTEIEMPSDIDFLPLDDEASKNHEKAIEIYNKLADIEGNDLIKRVLEEYRSATENIDLRSTIPLLETINGAENIAFLARLNLVKQIDRLLIAANEVLNADSSVRVDLYGHTREIDLEGIQNELWLIAMDTASIKKDIVEWCDPEGDDQMSASQMQNKIINHLQKYLFDSDKPETEVVNTQNLMIVGESGGTKLQQELLDRKVTNEVAHFIVDLPRNLTREMVEARMKEVAVMDRYEITRFFKKVRYQKQ